LFNKLEAMKSTLCRIDSPFAASDSLDIWWRRFNTSSVSLAREIGDKSAQKKNERIDV